ncbi:hypothetical protein B0T24DRAFT_598524 [Lasiosphaeria ovina]|uniref:DUF4336 domain-containing protein n=1 Tax=Lasiosphaeria ovina TaxID=92902 RepID=A0AAE0JWY3_9PEZI|nr:hypothetical protein B0T24DRAFT_598524 [Lasiosphaeria ovina]
MAEKLIPKNADDVISIRNVTESGNVVTLSVPFLRFGSIPIGGRATIVRLTSGALAVFSPVDLTPKVEAKLAEMGDNVKYLIAPDIEHHIFLSKWAEAYPQAILIGPEGLPEKREKMTEDYIGHEPFGVVFKASTKAETTISEEFDRDFSYEFVDAHAAKEITFLYKPEKVLIEADLMFNLPAIEQYENVLPADKPKPGVLARFFMRVQSTEGEAKGMKRLIWHAISRGNRTGFNESIARINAWDFDTIVPCHGETIKGNGKEVFQKVFDWHINGKK